jgi:hypothetical protein
MTKLLKAYSGHGKKPQRAIVPMMDFMYPQRTSKRSIISNIESVLKALVATWCFVYADAFMTASGSYTLDPMQTLLNTRTTVIETIDKERRDKEDEDRRRESEYERMRKQIMEEMQGQQVDEGTMRRLIARLMGRGDRTGWGGVDFTCWAGSLHPGPLASTIARGALRFLPIGVRREFGFPIGGTGGGSRRHGGGSRWRGVWLPVAWGVAPGALRGGTGGGSGSPAWWHGGWLPEARGWLR